MQYFWTTLYKDFVLIHRVYCISKIKIAFFYIKSYLQTHILISILQVIVDSCDKCRIIFGGCARKCNCYVLQVRVRHGRNYWYASNHIRYFLFCKCLLALIGNKNWHWKVVIIHTVCGTWKIVNGLKELYKLYSSLRHTIILVYTGCLIFLGQLNHFKYSIFLHFRISH